MIFRERSEQLCRVHAGADEIDRDSQVPCRQIITDIRSGREIDGSAAPGKSSGDAIATMDALANKVLPPGFSYEWTGLSLEQIQSGSQATMLSGLGLLVVYLTLAARFADHVLVLSQGRLVAQGAPAEALSEQVMSDVFRISAYRADYQREAVIVPWAEI